MQEPQAQLWDVKFLQKAALPDWLAQSALAKALSLVLVLAKALAAD